MSGSLIARFCEKNLAIFLNPAALPQILTAKKMLNYLNLSHIVKFRFDGILDAYIKFLMTRMVNKGSPIFL